MEHVLLNGDVIERLKSLPNARFKCIVTSPPYNIGKDYGTTVNDKKPMDEYLKWMEEVFVECKRLLTDDGSLFVNIGYSNVNPWIAMDVANVLRKHYLLQNQITWVKNISIEDVSYGHFKPINSKRFMNVTNESLFHFTKKGDVPMDRLAIGVPYMHKSNLNSRSQKGVTRADVRCRGNTWFVKYDTIQNKKERGHHPASFPVALANMCIRISGLKETDMVLDPFVGTGTTLVAAKELGFSGTGIDINREFLDFAKSRLE